MKISIEPKNDKRTTSTTKSFKVRVPTAFMTDVAAVVAAAASSRGIGANGDLAWRLSPDMQHFKKVTSTAPSPGLTNAVIMGRKTWESIPPKFRPLDGRTNIILTRKGKESINMNKQDGIVIASSLEEVEAKLSSMENVGNVFVIGGAQVYKEAIESGFVKRVIYTEVNLPQEVKFDAWFPDLKQGSWECRPYSSENIDCVDKENKDDNLQADGAVLHVDEKSGIRYKFLEYHKKDKKNSESSVMKIIEEGAHINAEETQYLEMCREIIESGVKRGDRTGTGTLSKFGTQMRFSLRDGTLPLLTTKRTFWRGVAEELLWFVKGSTNANDLAEKDIHIWDGNGSREFLDSRGLDHREVGDLGPVYGFQWRHFGATYKDMHTDYTGQGVDQLAECISKIKNNPEDRRIIMSAWNPADLNIMALPPCHMFCQFYVDTQKNELSCQMYQRSADMGLGVPFNIASYALLTHMIAHVTGLKPGDFVHTIGDAHVYLNHIDALKVQLERKPRAFPKIKINPEKKGIDDFSLDDFEVIGYRPHKTIKMKMAV